MTAAAAKGSVETETSPGWPKGSMETKKTLPVGQKEGIDELTTLLYVFTLTSFGARWEGAGERAPPCQSSGEISSRGVQVVARCWRAGRSRRMRGRPFAV